MDTKQIMQILEDTAYIRTGGTAEELRCAEYITNILAQWGLEGQIVPFDVPMADIQEAVLLVDGEEIPCKGYFCAGNGEVEAPFYYLRNTDKYSLSQCK